MEGKALANSLAMFRILNRPVLGSVEAQSLEVQGVFNPTVFAPFPAAVMALKACPIFEPRQVQIVKPRVVGELPAVEFPSLSMERVSSKPTQSSKSQWPRRAVGRPQCRPAQCWSVWCKTD